VLDLKGATLDDMMISIRAESAQLPSELVTINVINIDVSITSSGTATAGESYSLECTVNVTGSTEEPTIIWLDNATEITSTAARMVSGITGSADSGYSSILTFSPLRASDAGTFTCRATLGNVTNSQVFDVAVQGKCMYGYHRIFLLPDSADFKPNEVLFCVCIV
jgi:hypothetical protein